MTDQPVVQAHADTDGLAPGQEPRPEGVPVTLEDLRAIFGPVE